MVAEHRLVSCSYELDQRLTITALGPGWDEFALENGAIELLSPQPVGRPLFMYISDATTVELYEQLFKRVTDLKRSITVPIRCDAPAMRRFLNLTITPRLQGYVISTVLVRAEPRLAVKLLAPQTPRTDESLKVCSWCHRVEGHGRWAEVEEALSALNLFHRLEQPSIAHVVCNDCRRFMLAILADDAPIRPFE